MIFLLFFIFFLEVLESRWKGHWFTNRKFYLTKTDNLQDIKGGEGATSIPLHHFHLLIIAAHVITWLLLDETHPPLGISFWLKVNRIFLHNFLMIEFYWFFL